MYLELVHRVHRIEIDVYNLMRDAYPAGTILLLLLANCKRTTVFERLNPAQLSYLRKLTVACIRDPCLRNADVFFFSFQAPNGGTDCDCDTWCLVLVPPAGAQIVKIPTRILNHSDLFARRCDHRYEYSSINAGRRRSFPQPTCIWI